MFRRLSEYHGSESVLSTGSASPSQRPQEATFWELGHRMARFVRPTISALNVLAYNEVPEDRQVKVVSTVGQQAA